MTEDGAVHNPDGRQKGCSNPEYPCPKCGGRFEHIARHLKRGCDGSTD